MSSRSLRNRICCDPPRRGDGADQAGQGAVLFVRRVRRRLPAPQAREDRPDRRNPSALGRHRPPPARPGVCVCACVCADNETYVEAKAGERDCLIHTHTHTHTHTHIRERDGLARRTTPAHACRRTACARGLTRRGRRRGCGSFRCHCSCLRAAARFRAPSSRRTCSLRTTTGLRATGCLCTSVCSHATRMSRRASPLPAASVSSILPTDASRSRVMYSHRNLYDMPAAFPPAKGA